MRYKQMLSKNRLFATKSLDALQRSAQADNGLKRVLTLRDLVVMGIAGVVGTGVFVLTGQAAAQNAGPAVAVSFVVSAVAAALAGLCYAEMASMIAVAGSAYTYVYATLGELLAFIIGWDLILEYGVAAACVSSGWSGYAASFFRHATGIALPAAWSQAPLAYNASTATFEASGAWLNVPAVLILLFVTGVLILGMRLSMRVTLQVVIVKLAVIALFVVCAAPFVDVANWQPFVPDNAGSFGAFGWSGVLQAATILFFAYCGFDAVSTAAQECQRPQRDIPLAMIGSLATAAVLYVAVALVLTGVVPYQKLGVSDPIALGIAVTGHRWMALAVDVGALAGLTSVPDGADLRADAHPLHHVSGWPVAARHERGQPPLGHAGPSHRPGWMRCGARGRPAAHHLARRTHQHRDALCLHAGFAWGDASASYATRSGAPVSGAGPKLWDTFGLGLHLWPAYLQQHARHTRAPGALDVVRASALLGLQPTSRALRPAAGMTGLAYARPT